VASRGHCVFLLAAITPDKIRCGLLPDALF
jgi:hypothetical protein